jgi:NADH-quinone oxidoreductase subunit L
MEPLVFQLAWLIPVGPLLAFVLISLGLMSSATRRSRVLSQALALTGIVSALVLAQGVFWGTVRAPRIHEPGSLSWFTMGSDVMRVGVYIDPTAAVMLAMVTAVCLTIFIYSIGYMRKEPRANRFFAYISLFAGAMLGAMICDNLLALFLFWELMGVCSYLLIGFWWEKASAQRAALKAFIVTKIGDSFLVLGLVLLYAQVGSLAYRDVFSAATVARLAATPYLGPLSVATVATLLLFGGTVGKSAQVPLHVWLPDAMEGPTPASALIHAATMVSAGVYLMIRAFPLAAASQAMPVIALVGTVTAVYASVVAMTQSDIKRVLAFSTISQLGTMLAALGIGAYAACLFHLITHAFFKALLFMAAGSVIHGVDHGHHHNPGHAVLLSAVTERSNPNNMYTMGGLAFRMPLTAVTFLAGSLALSGFPLVTAGFWSKDEILSQAWGHNAPVFWMLALAAGLTAFYSARQIGLVFLTTPRSRAAIYARDTQPVMTMPLVVLALFSISLGWLGIPHGFPVLGRLIPDWFIPFVEASLGRGAEAAAPLTLAWQPVVIGVIVSLGGLAAGWWVYGRKAMQMQEDVVIDPLQAALARIGLGRLTQGIQEQFGIDRLYEAVVVQPVVKLSELSHLVDSQAIDALIVAFGRGFGREGRLIPAAEQLDRGFLDGMVNHVGMLSCLLARAAVTLDDWLIDGVVRTAGGIGRGLSGLLNLLDVGLIDRLVTLVAALIDALGRAVRRLQSGHLPDYLWNAFAVILLLVAILVFLQRV